MRILTTCLFLVFSNFLFAQKNITGTIHDSLKNEAIPFASVGLLKLPDSTIVKGTISNDAGEFMFDQLQSGNYAVKISAVGYSDKIIGNIHVDSSFSNKTNLQIQLSSSSHTFDEVAVTAIKRTVEFKNGNITVNVEDSPLAKGNTVLDLISKIPGVSVENDEIKIQGKSGVVLMIDDRPQMLSNQQLVNMMRGMSADMIKKVELLKNPPVKYDASGTSGMINIITKKTNIFGATGTISSSYSQGIYAEYISGFSLNYKSKKITFYSNLNGNYTDFFHLEKFKKQFVEDTAVSFLDGRNFVKQFAEGFEGRIGLDWNLSPSSVLGLKVQTAPGVYTFNSTGKNILSGDDNAQFNYLGSKSIMYDDWTQTDFSLDFNHQLDTLGSNFSIIADYTILPEYVNNKIYNGYYDASGKEVLPPNNYQNIDRSGSDLISTRANLTKKMNSSSSFETGLKFSQIKTFNDFLFKRDLTNNGVYVDDAELSNKFNYRELTYAGYFNYIKSIKKVNMQLGVRVENTYLKGSSDKQFALNKSYLKVFPNISFDYKKSDDHDFQLNLTRRINRPGFFQMNPVRQYRDQYFYEQGNPGLVPDFAYKAELAYNYKSSFNTSFAYTYVENVILGYTKQIDSTKLTIETVKNMKYQSAFDYNVFYQKSLLKKWDVTMNAAISYLSYNGDIVGVAFHRTGFSSMANLTNVFLLGKHTKFEVSGQFNGPSIYGIIERKMNGIVNVALKFSLLKEKLDLTLGMDDIFRTLKWNVVAKFETQNFTFYNRYDATRVRISLNYKFGKIKIEERKVSGDEDKERLGH